MNRLMFYPLLAAIVLIAVVSPVQAQQKKPNILVIWGAYQQACERTSARAGPLQPAHESYGNQGDPRYTTNDERHCAVQRLVVRRLRNQRSSMFVSAYRARLH